MDVAALNVYVVVWVVLVMRAVCAVRLLWAVIVVDMICAMHVHVHVYM